MSLGRLFASLLAVYFGVMTMAGAQGLVTNNVLDRVKKIGVGPATATAFTIEVDGRHI